MLTEETSKVRAIISAFPKAYPKAPKWFLFGGSYLESYKGIPKRDYYGASAYARNLESGKAFEPYALNVEGSAWMIPDADFMVASIT